MDRRASTSTSVKQDEKEEDEEEEERFIPISLSKSSSMMQEQLPKVSKKNKVPKKPLSPKSKGKQVISTKPTKSESIKRKRTQIKDIYDSVEDRYSVRERAGKLLLSLDADFASLPGFGKCMLPSNVTYSFWMILPTKFCNSHLPRSDTTITLVDEQGDEFKTNFLLDRHGLSAGWRGFSIGHRLIKGDILLFHLVEPCKFKVHIVRVNSLDIVEAALSLMDMEANGRATISGKGKKHKNAKKDTEVDKGKNYLEAPPIDACSSQAELEDGIVSGKRKKHEKAKKYPKVDNKGKNYLEATPLVACSSQAVEDGGGVSSFDQSQCKRKKHKKVKKDTKVDNNGKNYLDACSSQAELQDVGLSSFDQSQSKRNKHKKAKKDTKVDNNGKNYLDAPPMDACSSQVELQDGGVVPNFDQSLSKRKRHKKAKKDTKVDKGKNYLDASPVDACSSRGLGDCGRVSSFDQSCKVEQYESSSDEPRSKVLEGSEITNHSRSDEVSGSGSSCYRDHLQEGISYRSAVRRYDSSSTVATQVKVAATFSPPLLHVGPD